MMPPCAFPESANCAAWLTFSPSTRYGWIASRKPGVTQRLCAAAVGRMVWIGDGETCDLPGGKGGCADSQHRPGYQGPAAGNHHHHAPDSVEVARSRVKPLSRCRSKINCGAATNILQTGPPRGSAGGTARTAGP